MAGAAVARRAGAGAESKAKPHSAAERGGNRRAGAGAESRAGPAAERAAPPCEAGARRKKGGYSR